MKTKKQKEYVIYDVTTWSEPREQGTFKTYNEALKFARFHSCLKGVTIAIRFTHTDQVYFYYPPMRGGAFVE